MKLLVWVLNCISTVNGWQWRLSEDPSCCWSFRPFPIWNGLTPCSRIRTFCKFKCQRRKLKCFKDELTISKIRGARVLTMFRFGPFIMRIYWHNLKQYRMAVRRSCTYSIVITFSRRWATAVLLLPRHFLIFIIS